MFKVLKDDIRLVFLSACFSLTQARNISKWIDCVIGVDQTIADDSALLYAVRFYGTLALGESIKAAHDQGLILAFEGRPRKDQVPRLIHRAGIDPDKIKFGARRTSRPQKSASGLGRPAQALGNRLKLAHFEEARRKYGVWAESISVEKLCGIDGSCTFTWEVKNLAVTSGEIKELHFDIESVAGLVDSPVPDKNARELSIRWESDADSEPRTMEEMIDRVRQVHGKFRFAQSLRPGIGPYTFGWTIKLLNADALTDWEFRNLYPDGGMKHVDEETLDPPQEYFARLVWIPISRLVAEVVFPEGFDGRPRLSYFELRGQPQIPPEHVISNGVLRTFPIKESDWYRNNGRWERDVKTERSEQPALRSKSRLHWGVEVNHPHVGSFYSVDWPLDDRRPTLEAERLIREAEVVRSELVQHRGRQVEKGKGNSTTPESRRINETFDRLDTRVRKQYASKSGTEKFETALLTYDDRQYRMVMVEGRLNGGEVTEKSWGFWLPFGLGLTGACFRAGVGAFQYRRTLDRRNPDKPENYLPIPGSDPHEFVLALPIDHPELDEDLAKRSAVPRARQLIGVFAISSTYKASGLLALCKDAFSKAEFDALVSFREDCQAHFDEISNLLLSRSSQQSGS